MRDVWITWGNYKQSKLKVVCPLFRLVAQFLSLGFELAMYEFQGRGQCITELHSLLHSSCWYQTLLYLVTEACLYTNLAHSHSKESVQQARTYNRSQIQLANRIDHRFCSAYLRKKWGTRGHCASSNWSSDGEWLWGSGSETLRTMSHLWHLYE